MPNAVWILSLGSLIVVMGCWVQYLRSIPVERVSKRPVGSIVGQLLGLVLAVLTFWYGAEYSGWTRVGVMLPAAFATMMGLFFLWLLSQRKTPIGEIRVTVGDPLIPFAAKTSSGDAFHSDALAGKRILLKFFRGGW